MRRRQVLAVLTTAVGVAGAGRSGGGPADETDAVGTADASSPATPTPSAPTATTRGPTVVGDFVLWNDDDRTHEVGLTVHREGTTLVDTTRTLRADGSVRVDNPIERQGTYRVVATLDGDQRRATTWHVTSCREYEYWQLYVAPDGTLELRPKRVTVVPALTCG